MASVNPALQYHDVGFRYAAGPGDALREISLRIDRGERVALVGANGAGKSTLLLLATGLITPTSGRIEVDGVVLGPRTVREVRRRLALVFADPDDQLFCPTVVDEVAFAPRQRGVGESQCIQRAGELLGAVGLSGYDAREPLDLSLGEKKRLAIAAALASDAPVLLLDEPTSGLDPRARRQLLELLPRLTATTLFATHDLDAALEIATRVVVLSAGTVVAQGPAASILRDRELLQSHGLELPLSLSGR